MGRQTDEDFTRRRYRVRHRTTYEYTDEVTACYERGFLAPRVTPTQRIVSTDVYVEPTPDLVSEHIDHFGNHSYYVEIRTPHSHLEIIKTSVVDVEWPPVDMAALNTLTVGEAVAQVADELDAVERTTFLMASPLIDLAPSVREYADAILPPDRPLGEALEALVHTVYRDFHYTPGATSVRTTLPELLASRAGVCQDFAHLAVGCLRSVGLPARYVSGYIETTKTPGKVRLQGSDASHAWTSVHVPGGWVDLDPTNDHLADSRYVVTAWGRDFRDVSPLKGVVFTEGSSTLDVGVDVTRLT